MHISILKLVYTYSEPLHLSATYVAIIRDVKYRGKSIKRTCKNIEI